MKRAETCSWSVCNKLYLSPPTYSCVRQVYHTLLFIYCKHNRDDIPYGWYWNTCNYRRQLVHRQRFIIRSCPVSVSTVPPATLISWSISPPPQFITLSLLATTSVLSIPFLLIKSVSMRRGNNCEGSECYWHGRKGCRVAGRWSGGASGAAVILQRHEPKCRWIGGLCCSEEHPE